MNKSSVMSLKSSTLLCYFMSVSVLLALPIYLSFAVHVVVLVLALFLMYMKKEDSVLKMLCLSVSLNAAICCMGGYYNIYDFMTMTDIFYHIIYYIVTIAPLLFVFHKNKNVDVRLGVILIALSLLPRIFGKYDTQFNITRCVFMLSMTIYFFLSAKDTENKGTRYISYGAGGASILMMLNPIIFIIYEYCPQPEYNGWEFWANDYSDSYPVFQFCRDFLNQTGLWTILCGVLMALYFFYILKRSNMTLKAICIPAIIACVVFGAIMARDVYLPAELILLVFIPYAYSFYKLNKLF